MTLIGRDELLRTLSSSAVSRRCKSGTLHLILPRVYSTEPPTYADLCGAVVMWKPDAVLSHDTAAWLWGLLDEEPTTVHATLPPRDRHDGPRWLTLHRRKATSVEYVGELPVVDIAATFVDVATTMNVSALEKFIDSALTSQVRWKDVAQAVEQAKGRHGVAALRKQLRQCCPRTLSEPERVVARALTARRFSMDINCQVGQFYGDLVDRKARVIIEIDGRAFHSDSHVFTQDRVRQNTLVLDNWLVLRFSAVHAMARTDDVADLIIAVVRRRRKARS